jgi:hypothetical protein
MPPVFRWVKPNELRMGPPQAPFTSDVVVAFSTEGAEPECEHKVDAGTGATTLTRRTITSGAHKGTFSQIARHDRKHHNDNHH